MQNGNAGQTPAASGAATGATGGTYPTNGRPPVPGSQQQKPASATHEATTVRNLVNLKKHTLKLTPRAGSPETLDISFTLDAVSSCRCNSDSHDLQHAHHVLDAGACPSDLLHQ
jgi:hypothetical protein